MLAGRSAGWPIPNAGAIGGGTKELRLIHGKCSYWNAFFRSLYGRSKYADDILKLAVLLTDGIASLRLALSEHMQALGDGLNLAGHVQIKKKLVLLVSPGKWSDNLLAAKEGLGGGHSPGGDAAPQRASACAWRHRRRAGVPSTGGEHWLVRYGLLLAL